MCVGACPHGRPSSKGSDSVSVSVSVSDVWFVNERSPPAAPSAAPVCLLCPRQSPKHTVSSGERKDMAPPRTPQAAKCCTRAAWRCIPGSTPRTQTLALHRKSCPPATHCGRGGPRSQTPCWQGGARHAGPGFALRGAVIAHSPAGCAAMEFTRGGQDLR